MRVAKIREFDWRCWNTLLRIFLQARISCKIFTRQNECFWKRYAENCFVFYSQRKFRLSIISTRLYLNAKFSLFYSAAVAEETGHSNDVKVLRKRPPPLVRSRTLPAIVVPGLNILQAQIESKYKGKLLMFIWTLFKNFFFALIK